MAKKWSEAPFAGLRLWSGIAVVCSFMIFLGGASYSFSARAENSMSKADLPGVLLAAAALALFALSFLVALGGVFGWREVNNRISEEIARQVAISRREHVGHTRFTTGLFFGRLCREGSEGEYLVTRKDLLEFAIVHTQEALDALSGTPSEIRAINNLAFYYALSGNPTYGKKAAEYAARLRDHCGSRHAPDMMNTYICVVGAFPTYFKDPYNTLVEAKEIAEHIIAASNVRESDKQNARRHLATVTRALQTVTTTSHEELT